MPDLFQPITLDNTLADQIKHGGSSMAGSFLLNPLMSFIETGTKHRLLVWELARREIADRYAGQMFGLFWAVGHPLILMALYVFIFVFVFKSNIGGTPDMPRDYTAYLLSGLIPWMGFQESMSKAVTSITGNSGLVKQVVFPVEVLPLRSVVSSCMTQTIFVLALAGYIGARQPGLPWTCALVPALFFLQALAMAGVGYLLASVGVFFRDLKDLVQVFCTIGVYVMPIFYLPAMVPGMFKPFLYLNPFSYLAWCWQDALYFGRFEHPTAWICFPLLCIAVLAAGQLVFNKTKILFGNVL